MTLEVLMTRIVATAAFLGTEVHVIGADTEDDDGAGVPLHSVIFRGAGAEHTSAWVKRTWPEVMADGMDPVGCWSISAWED
jgi:hypothetical protein